MALQAEDLFVGRYVTVLKGHNARVQTMWGRTYEVEQNALCASVLRVLGLSLPYVAVEVLYCSGGHAAPGTKLSLDTRVMTFALVDEGYARALVPPQLLQGKPAPPVQRLPPQSHWGRSLVEELEACGKELMKHWPADERPSPETTQPASPVLSIPRADCDICGGENFEHATTCVRHPKNRAKRNR